MTFWASAACCCVALCVQTVTLPPEARFSPLLSPSHAWAETKINGGSSFPFWGGGGGGEGIGRKKDISGAVWRDREKVTGTGCFTRHTKHSLKYVLVPVSTEMATKKISQSPCIPCAVFGPMGLLLSFPFPKPRNGFVVTF